MRLRSLAGSKGTWATLGFLLAWTLLDAVVNVRYPGKETRLWYLVPSVDIILILVAFAVFARLGRRVPPFLHVTLAGALILVRLLRVADGISMRFLHRPFNLYVNLSLLPELPRLLGATVPVPALVLGALALVLGLVALGWLTILALYAVEQSLTQPANVKLLGAVTAFFAVASCVVPRGRYDERYLGAFASSGFARVLAEGVSIVHAQGYRAREEHAIAEVRQKLAHMPTNLSKLAGADVLLFIVESYGESTLTEPAQRQRILPELSAFERELGAAGYTMASSVLDSPTFGGSSWLAHAALNTGVRTENQLEYELLVLKKPLTLGDFFHAAGYRTVLVQPATTRATLDHEYLSFDRKYFAAAFDYQGPSFGWGTVPDQYVLDFVHRRELAERSAGRPRFIEYALITSHAPWSKQASIVADWSTIGTGTILKTLPIHEHDTAWSRLDHAGDAYVDAIVYDLEVLRRYLRDGVKDDTLVIILGDHQPPGGVTGANNGHGVPVHVLSRRASLVEPFEAHGYSAGMNPARSGPHPGLETFLVSFLRDFSEDLRQTNALGGHAP